MAIGRAELLDHRRARRVPSPQYRPELLSRRGPWCRAERGDGDRDEHHRLALAVDRAVEPGPGGPLAVRVQADHVIGHHRRHPERVRRNNQYVHRDGPPAVVPGTSPLLAPAFSRYIQVDVLPGQIVQTLYGSRVLPLNARAVSLADLETVVRVADLRASGGRERPESVAPRPRSG